MRYLRIKELLLAVFVMISAGHADYGNADSAVGIIMDAEGISRTFTGLAFITCSSTGNEPTDYLEARIRDNSPPVAGLLLNLQLLKTGGLGLQHPVAVNISDTISGDADFSPVIQLHGGNGVYFLIVNKTDEGEREFDLDWHCKAASGTHTVTEIGVYQFQ